MTETVELVFVKGTHFEACVCTSFYVMTDTASSLYSVLVGKSTLRQLAAHVHPLNSTLVYYPRLQQGDRTTTHALPVISAVPATPEQSVMIAEGIPAAAPVILAVSIECAAPACSEALGGGVPCRLQ